MALVIARRPGESLVMQNGLIEITVVETRSNRVTLAITAPRSIDIRRTGPSQNKQRPVNRSTDTR